MPRLARGTPPCIRAVLFAALLASGAAVVTPSGAAAQAAAPPRATLALASDFTLDDQFDHPHAVRFADAPLTLLVFSGRTTAREGAAWVRQLRPALAAASSAARVVEVAALGNPSRLTRPIVRRVFRGQAPIPLDWDDAVAARFGYRVGAARVVLVDAAGRVLGAASGAPTEAGVAAFRAATAGPHPAPTATAPAPHPGTFD